jgi:hypothetical protein
VGLLSSALRTVSQLCGQHMSSACVHGNTTQLSNTAAGLICALILGLGWPWLGATISSWQVRIPLVCWLFPAPFSACSSLRILVLLAQHTYRWKLQVKDYRVVPTINLCTIFVISGLTLKTQDAIDALKAPKGLVYGLISILGITPLLGFAVLRLPFKNEPFSTGLAVFCAVPTTLSSGIALVQAVCIPFS